MKTSLLLITSMTSAAIMPTAAKPVKETKPNVIVILADDLGYGEMSAYGAKHIATPNLDKLANGGVRFTRGYATSATSTPSRYALMTGEYPWRNKDAQILSGDAPLIISEKQATMPKMMQVAGYKTGAIGKWHLGMGGGNVDWNKPITPNANSIGFDYSCLIAATQDRVPTVYIENGTVVGLEKEDPLYVSYTSNFDGQPTGKQNPELLKMMWSHGHDQSVHNGISRIGYQTGGKNALWVDEDMADYFVEKVMSFIDKNKSTPFFLYYGLHQPHVPRTPHVRFAGASGMGPRGDAIIEADWCVGELLNKLEKEGLLENTLIFFSSDNGPVINDGYLDMAVEMLGNHTPAGILRGGKYSLYEAGTRVPFITYWKGTIKPRISDAMVCQMDIYPSLAKLIETNSEPNLDGLNMLLEFLGKSDKGRAELVIEATNRLAYRSGNWVLIPPYKGQQRNITGNEVANLGEWTLHNLKDDIKQEKNLAEKSPKKLENMKDKFLLITKGYYPLKDRR